MYFLFSYRRRIPILWCMSFILALWYTYIQCILIAFQAPDHVMGEENSACPRNKGRCWLGSRSGWDQGHERWDSQDAGQIHSADEAAGEDDTGNGESSVKVTSIYLTMFWLKSSKHEQNDFQENVTIYHYWYKWDTLQERHHCHKRRCPAED